MFYNPKRKHTNNGMLSPVDFEIRQEKLKQAGVQETGRTSDRAFAACGFSAATSVARFFIDSFNGFFVRASLSICHK